MRYILLFFIVVFSYSKTITATYNVKYGWFGTVVVAKATYKTDATNYKIIVTVKTKGMVASMSHNLVQTYISEGKIIDNTLVPTHYILDIKKHGDDYYRLYTFDHINKTVLKKRFKNGKLTKEYKYYYAPDDILTLYWNLPIYLKKENKKLYTFYAVGGSKKDGRIDISFPSKSELKKLKKDFRVKGLYMKLNLYNKVFAGDKGILYLAIDKRNWVTLVGMVKNVLKVGNLKGKIDKFSIDSQ